MVLLFLFAVIAKTAGVNPNAAPRAIRPAHWPSPAPRRLESCPPLPRASPPAPVRTMSARPRRRRARRAQTHRPRAVFRMLRSFIVTSALVLDVDAIGFGTPWACPVRDLATLDGHQGRMAGAE